jgi:alpha-glucosidase
VGPQPLLPKKAYGFFQTQHLLCGGDQADLVGLGLAFRERDIPCDTFIVDIEWGDGCDGDSRVMLGSRMDWSPNYTVPLSPEEMIAQLRRMHFDLMLIHHSAPDFPNRFHQGWTPTVWDEATWWSKLMEGLNIGVQGTWQDTRRNDITDSVIYKGLQDYFGPDQRVLFLGCRDMQKSHPWPIPPPNAIPINQMIGARRYPFDWTGDCDHTWSELKWQIRAITNTHGSMKGTTYLTSDSVGWDWKIQARWNQFIDFNSVSRSHYMMPWGAVGNAAEGSSKGVAVAREGSAPQNVQDEPTGLPTAEASIRKHRQLRYRLVPYLYSQAFTNYQTGMPICRPLLLAFPDDGNCSADQWPYQYMFGESILVAPVYADVDAMEIYLPGGTNWIDFWSKDVYSGGEVILYDTSDIEKLPLFVQEGAILPMREDSNWIDPTLPDDPLFLDIYPAKASSFVLYEDDGVSTHYQQGAYTQTRFTCLKDANGNVRIHIGKAQGDYVEKLRQRRYILNVRFCDARPKEVKCNGRILNIKSEQTFRKTATNEWLYDPEDGNVRILVDHATDKKTRIDIAK